MIRLGLIGVGRMGRNYERIFANHAEIRLDPCDPPLGIEPKHREEWAGAIVATPTRTHLEVALPLMRSDKQRPPGTLGGGGGLHVLIEKPIAATLKEGEELARAPRPRGRYRYAPCFVGHVERFNPAVAAIPDRPRFVQVERLAEWVDRGIDVDVVLDLMVHDLDLFLSLHDYERVVDVRANGVCIATGEIDLAQARIELASGAVGTFTASRVSRKRSRTWRAFAADRSYTSVDLDRKTAVRVDWDGGPRETVIPVSDHNALEQQVLAFVSAIQGGQDRRLATARQGLKALELAWRVQNVIGRGRGGADVPAVKGADTE